MKLAALLIFSVALACVQPASDVAEEAVDADVAIELYTIRTARLRDGPSLTAPSLGVLPAGDTVIALDCSDGWCSVSYGTGEAYIQESYLSDVPPEPTRAAPPRPDRSSRAPAASRPLVDEPDDEGPPSGATARCRDGTYSYSQSRSGTCSRHGGVAEWY